MQKGKIMKGINYVTDEKNPAGARIASGWRAYSLRLARICDSPAGAHIAHALL